MALPVAANEFQMKFHQTSFKACALVAAFFLSATSIGTVHAQTCGLQDRGATYFDADTGLEIRKCWIGETWSGTACVGQVQVLKWDDAVRRYEKGDWRLLTKEEAEQVKHRSSRCSPIRWPQIPSPNVGNNGGFGLYGVYDGNGRVSGYLARLARASQPAGDVTALGARPPDDSKTTGRGARGD